MFNQKHFAMLVSHLMLLALLCGCGETGNVTDTTTAVDSTSEITTTAPIEETEEEMLSNIDQIGEAAARVKAAGGEFFYHNHNFEFQRLSTGETVFDRILNTLPDVNFTLDTYWLQSGGVAVLEYIKKAAGRLCCVHLKDYLPTFPEGQFKAKFAPVGEGNINWQDVIPAFRAAGAEYYLVEQDDATDYEDPFREVGSSIAYLKKNFG